MELKYKVLIAVISLTLSFAAGRWLAPTKVVTEVKTITVKEIQKDENKNVETRIIKHSDGSTETVIRDRSEIDENGKTTVSLDNTRLVERPVGRLNISGTSAIDRDRTIVYGFSVNRNILGPITLGVFGMTNKTVGISLGVDL